MDPFCTKGSFSIHATGTYITGSNSPVIRGAKEFDFRMNSLKITPRNMDTVNTLNAYGKHKCGKPNSWKMNQIQDVTNTGGCVTLGITLPNIEYDILKIEREGNFVQLFVGERPTESLKKTSNNIRPTSFQVPLTKCDKRTILSQNRKRNSVLR